MSMRDKYEMWYNTIFDGYIMKKYPNFLDVREVNSCYKELFYQEDFEELTHPKFWNLETNYLTKKERKRNRSRQSSISQGIIGYEGYKRAK
mmetsp:Transcript_3437/g.5159  ORF Transcript_3437/g.5159 Transcript_3437/m.5159 type:complete len:91 (+) Transcript_3437:1153-1425(+)